MIYEWDRREYAISVAPTMEDSDIPSDLPSRDSISPTEGEWLMPGNGIICSPLGEIIAGPMQRERFFES